MTSQCADEEMGSESDGSPTRSFPQNSCLGDHRNLPSPFISLHLPAELLASVFIHIARDSYIDKKYSYCTPSRPSWVDVSYVCSYWREVALDCPTLWSYIPATSQRWTMELLARSQMAPLKISAKVISRDYPFKHIYSRVEEKKAQALSIVVQVMNHSQRIKKLRLDSIARAETGDQIVSKFLFTQLPCLEHLEIHCFNLPEAKLWSLFTQNTPALHTLMLEYSSMPWSVLGPSLLTTLHLSHGGMSIHKNRMTDFLAMLRRMPHLVQLSVDHSLPSARDFLSNGEFDATPMISLSHLSYMSLQMTPLSAVIALVACVDIPLMAQVVLHVQPEYEFEGVTPESTLDDYVRLASLLGQRISQSDSPKLRSLTIWGVRHIGFAFSTSDRVECLSPDPFWYHVSGKALLGADFNYGQSQMDCIGNHVLRGIYGQIPFKNVQSVHFSKSWFSPEFWGDMLAFLSDVRHIKFSRSEMPEITSRLSLPSQDGRADRSQGDIFVPALEELELYQTSLQLMDGLGVYPNSLVADVQELYAAIATRKETRCRLSMKDCFIKTAEGVVQGVESVGWWEGAEFRVTSNIDMDMVGNSV